ncbi:DUF5681 domain-containing protein [Phenylobacterium immobile]|uniref:DUF5681 domain-containing protein n=1 Tax=Phenylobacterium immobile TaxID=21 RepID=UPI000A9D3A68|nr:DUF5681 domain-containing protein [Phenylobacterium immobile]
MAKNSKRPGGSPPKTHQFKPGQSGNPGGRPKKKKTMRDAIDVALERMVEATLDGQRQSMPLKDALANTFLAKIGSDPELFIRAMRWLEGENPPAQLVEADPSILADFEADEDAAIYDATIARELRRRGDRETEDDSDV